MSTEGRQQHVDGCVSGCTGISCDCSCHWLSATNEPLIERAREWLIEQGYDVTLPIRQFSVQDVMKLLAAFASSEHGSQYPGCKICADNEKLGVKPRMYDPAIDDPTAESQKAGTEEKS